MTTKATDFMTPEMASAELNSTPEFQEVQQLDIDYAMFRALIRELLGTEEGGQVDSGQVDAAIGIAIQHHAQSQLDIFGLDVEVEVESKDEDDDEQMEGDEVSPSGSAMVDLGQVLASVLDQNHDDPREAVATISQVSGMSPDEVVGVISGQVAPHPEQTQAIADHFFDHDEESHDRFMALGQQAYQEAMDGMPDMEPASAMANMSSADYALRAEFNAMKDQQEIGMLMRYLEKKADELHANNLLTPAERNYLVRSDIFRNDPDSVAVFCQFCNENKVSPREYLSHVEFCLNWKEQSGPSNYGAFFSQSITEPIDVLSSEVRESQDYAQDYRSRNGYQ